MLAMGLGNIVMTIMAVVTLSIGVYLNKVGTKEFTASTEVQAPSVLSEETQVPEVIVTPTPLESPVPTIIPKPVNTPKPTVIPQNTTSNLNDFIYTGATINVQTANSLTLASSEDPKKIISWYQEKLKQLQFAALSVASSNTNGNYSTKMAAAKEKLKLDIEILKPASASSTIIKINLSN